eukprot:7137396-Alexandrium_andersonii.AAC.1
MCIRDRLCSPATDAPEDCGEGEEGHFCGRVLASSHVVGARRLTQRHSSPFLQRGRESARAVITSNSGSNDRRG